MLREFFSKLKFLGLPLVVAVFFALSPTPAQAAYTDNNIIDDSVFLNSSSMSQADIQNFLNGKSGAIKNYSAPNTDPGQNNRMMSAAEIIYFASQYVGINPRVIMATLQKEQSLITEVNPSAGKYNYAMGYGCPDSGGCSGSSGFYYQVVTGAWQLRLNFERAGGSSAPWTSPSGRTWGTNIGYACSGATRYYSTGLYAGRSVTFYGEDGTAYKTFNLDNRGTASMYCYTPHAYNSSNNGALNYSGSYNFVISYESWWGSTRTASYSWQYAGQSSSTGLSMVSTQKGTWTLSAVNTGTVTWSNTGANPVRLGTSRNIDRTSVFCGCNRAATLNEAAVAPGGVGTFTFTVQAPTAPGRYNEYFNLVAEGATWMNDPGLYWGINVSAATMVGTLTSNTIPTSISANSSGTGTISVRNDGNVAWYRDGNNPIKLGTYGPTDRLSAFFTDGWIGQTRPALINNSIDPGQIATFTVPIHAPAISNTYLEVFSLLSEGYKWFNQPINSSITVSGGIPQPLDRLESGQFLTPGQLLTSADSRYRLVLQSDGNLVLYSPSRPLWWSGTQGRAVARFILQGDSNMVIYGTQGQPYWASWTQGRNNTKLVVQSDGNLVLYDAQGAALWNTRTSGQL